MDSRTTIALTGAKGFIGAALCQSLLDAGFTSIRCLSRNPVTDNLDPRITWIKGSLFDPFSLEDFIQDSEVVIHAAALESYRMLDKARLFEVNARGTANLVNAALHMGVHHFLHISSAEALGRPLHVSLVNEEAVWSKSPHHTPYAESRYQAELEVWRGMEEGLPATIIQPSLLLDPLGHQRITRLMIDWIEKGHRYFPPGGGHLLDLGDLTRFVIDRLHHAPTMGRILLAGEYRSYQQLLVDLAKHLQKPAPHISLPPVLGRVLSLWNQMTGGVGLHPQEVMLAFNEIQYDVSLSTDKYTFNYTPLEESLAAIAANTRKQ